MTCVLCKLDEHECSAEDRLAAYFVVGMVHGEMPDPCRKHTKMMVTGAAVFAESKGVFDDTAKELRRIATKEPLRLVPSGPDGGAER